MRYVSTRGTAPVLGFSDVLLSGLADDGGLYVPERWPPLEPGPRGAVSRPYVEVATEVMAPYVAGSIHSGALASQVEAAYKPFTHPDVAPLVELGDGYWLLELFHGPTLAFKDIALQLVGQLFDHELKARGSRVTIVGATSGDTGSAAIEACRDRDAIDVVILHPEGRVSEVQRRQMTTVDSPNVHNVAIEGTFDDCQDLVKGMFGDEHFRRDLRLSAVNSINWARVMAQIVYYVAAAERLGGRDQPVAFSVPTGNFGNVFAGYGASRMGLAIHQLVVGSNRNDVLHRFFQHGEVVIGDVSPTLSPSMDIQVSSNLERLLFELHDHDGAAIVELMGRLRRDGRTRLDDTRLAGLRRRWASARVDDEATLAVIADLYHQGGLLVDPHTAVGVAAARACRADPTIPMVCLATAHPAKFPDAVQAATGVRPPLPPHLADLYERPEHVTHLPNDLQAVQGFVRSVARG